MNRRDPLRTALALLLVVSAVLFAIGTTLERGESDTHEPAAAEGHGEGEQGEEGATPEEASGGESSGEASGESSEEILGIDAETPVFVALGVVVSLALAAGVWFARRRELVLVAGLFAVVFVALDVREVLHQLDESNGGIAALAALIALLHAAVAVVAGALYRRQEPLAS